MFDTQQESSDTHYPITVALLIVAFVFSPLVLILSQASGYVAPSLALAFSACCVAWAWINCKPGESKPGVASSRGVRGPRVGSRDGRNRRFRMPLPRGEKSNITQ